MGLNLVYMNVVPPDADVRLVRYDERPTAITWRYLTDVLGQPLDVVLCPSLKWGCRYLRVDHRTLVDHVWDEKAMADLLRGGADQVKLAAIEGLVLRDRSLRFAILDDSRLFAADLIGADLRSVSLKNAGLLRAKLSNALLQGADLTGAQLQFANLSGAQLQHTYLSGAQLQGAILSDAQLQDAYLYAARLQGADLSGAQLKGANLPIARLQGANLSGAQLKGANLPIARLQGANLSGAQLQGANLSPPGGPSNAYWSAIVTPNRAQGLDPDRRQGRAFARHAAVGRHCRVQPVRTPHHPRFRNHPARGCSSAS